MVSAPRHYCLWIGPSDNLAETNGRVIMLVVRWQAPVLPDMEQVKTMFEAEGLEPLIETTLAQNQPEMHRHPFDEVRMIVSGEMHLNISGNKLKLAAGDKIEIPSNTRHVTWVEKDHECLSVSSFRPFRI